MGEIWHVAPEWLAGDRFDALMNYPLAEAIIGYVGGRSLNEPLLRSHHEYGQTERLDGAGFGHRLGELLAAYAPETNAVQLNLLDSHDSPRVFSLLGGDREAMELAVLLQATLPGRAMHLLRRRGRAPGRHRPGFAPGLSRGTSRAGTTSCSRLSGSRSRCVAPSPRCAPTA